MEKTQRQVRHTVHSSHGDILPVLGTPVTHQPSRLCSPYVCRDPRELGASPADTIALPCPSEGSAPGRSKNPPGTPGLNSSKYSSLVAPGNPAKNAKIGTNSLNVSAPVPSSTPPPDGTGLGQGSQAPRSPHTLIPPTPARQAAQPPTPPHPTWPWHGHCVMKNGAGLRRGWRPRWKRARDPPGTGRGGPATAQSLCPRHARAQSHPAPPRSGARQWGGGTGVPTRPSTAAPPLLPHPH